MTLRRVRTSAIAALSCAVLLAACGQASLGGRELVWSDEFSGAAGAAPDPASAVGPVELTGAAFEVARCRALRLEDRQARTAPTAGTSKQTAKEL